MAIYRVCKRLSTGQVPGDVVDGEAFRDGVVPVLLARGALKVLEGPPLTELPGWVLRAEALAEFGVMTATDFLETDDELVRDVFGYRSTRAVERWKGEVRRWLMPGPVKKRG